MYKCNWTFYVRLHCPIYCNAKFAVDLVKASRSVLFSIAQPYRLHVISLFCCTFCIIDFHAKATVGLSIASRSVILRTAQAHGLHILFENKYFFCSRLFLYVMLSLQFCKMCYCKYCARISQLSRTLLITEFWAPVQYKNLVPVIQDKIIMIIIHITIAIASIN